MPKQDKPKKNGVQEWDSEEDQIERNQRKKQKDRQKSENRERRRRKEMTDGD